METSEKDQVGGDPDSEPDFELGDVTTIDPTHAAALAPWQRFPFQPRMTAADRTRRAASLVAIVLLSLLVLLAGSPGLRNGAIQLADGWLPAPIAARGPINDRFYLLPNVPWGTVLLDGRPLVHIPLASTSHPLRLAHGQHVFEWRATPFMPLRCQVSVPDEQSDMCWLDGQTARIYLEHAPDGAFIIPAHDDLSALPVKQRAALLMATQFALEQSDTQALIQPGERYAYLPGLSSVDRISVASQKLLATLTFHLISLGAREPCAVGDPRIQPCRFPAQDCSQFCTLPVAPVSDIKDVGSPIWFASTLAWASWNYDTLTGAPVAHNQGDPGVNFRLIDLGITWDGATWHVTPLFGHQANLPSIDDTVCSAARVWLARGPLAPLLPDGDSTSAITYFSSGIPADGCAVRVTPQATGRQSGSPVEAALFLVRCGVLVAANAPAHALWPVLPMGDDAQMAMAIQLAAQS